MTDKVISFLSHSDPDPFDFFFKKAPVMMHSIDANGILQKVSTFWADRLGYDIDDMIGRPSVDFLSPQSQEAAKAILAEFFRTGSIHNVEYDFVARDGSIVPVLMSATAERDEKGEFKRSLAVMFDNAEAKRVQAQLRQKQRMEAIGQLVGGVAHDFNNLLSVIQGNLEFLQDDLDHPQRDTFLHDALGASRRGAALTEQLLSFGRRAYLRPTGVNLNTVIRENDSMLRRLMPANIGFELITTGGLWMCELDRAQLDTAILNVINNAKDAMPEGGTVTLETANVRVKPEMVGGMGEDIEPGRYVMLAISDTGTGMSEEVAERAFEPFFTTHPVGGGSGLGLSMVHGFVRQSNGAVQIYSEANIGTTLRMYFRAVGPDTGDGKSQDYDATRSGKTPLLADVLVVEDEADVRKVFVQQLANQGMHVAEASSGDLAHGLLVTGYRPKVLITDVVMPGKLQGPDLAALARELIPDLRVVFVSGYPQEPLLQDRGMRVSDVQLYKPVTRSKLLQAVKKMLADD